MNLQLDHFSENGFNTNNNKNPSLEEKKRRENLSSPLSLWEHQKNKPRAAKNVTHSFLPYLKGNECLAKKKKKSVFRFFLFFVLSWVYLAKNEKHANEKKGVKKPLFSWCGVEPKTCRDGWLGFPYLWRTQQSAISGMNCRISPLLNLWTQKALGRNPLWVIPVHAVLLSVEKQQYISSLCTFKTCEGGSGFSKLRKARKCFFAIRGLGVPFVGNDKIKSIQSFFPKRFSECLEIKTVTTNVLTKKKKKGFWLSSFLEPTHQKIQNIFYGPECGRTTR